MRKYEDIKPSNRINFAMVYYYAVRTLTKIETLFKKAYGNLLPSDHVTTFIARNLKL